MYSHPTKIKGDTGLGFIIADLLSKGIQVALPISEHLPFDCIAISSEGRLSRLSVKYRAVDATGRIDVPLRSVWSNSSGCHTRPYDRSEFDAIAVYCPNTKQCYYVHIQEILGTRLSLRVTEPKQKQKTAPLASSFLDVDVIFGEVAELV